MKSVGIAELGRRITELLRLGPDSTLELQLLRDGSVRISKEIYEPDQEVG